VSEKPTVGVTTPRSNRHHDVAVSEDARAAEPYQAYDLSPKNCPECPCRATTHAFAPPPILLHAGIMQADDDVGKVAAASTHLVGTGRRRTAMNGTSAPLPVTSLTPSTHAPPLNDSRGHRGVPEGGDQWRRLRGRVAGIETPDAGAHQGARWVLLLSSYFVYVSRLASRVSRSRSFARQ
jgi:hypothetical protein